MQCTEVTAVTCCRGRQVWKLLSSRTQSISSAPPSLRARDRFVPKVAPLLSADVEVLQRFVSDTDKLLVITGAGLSTESGIPDYRSEGVGLYSRSSFRPVQHSEFMEYADRRQMYWARNFIGWKYFHSRRPNRSHVALAEWEKAGKLSWLITQNVDSLHIKAGSKKVTELHGSSRQVICVGCREVTSRKALQERMMLLNPEFQVEPVEIAPDGDVILTRSQVETFKVPPCQSCGGVLKPKVVFFGDNVPRDIVTFLYKKVTESDAVLVAGSSLQVFSAFRFVRTAKEENKPIAIINIGPTRADSYADVNISAKLGKVLPQIQV